MSKIESISISIVIRDEDFASAKVYAESALKNFCGRWKLVDTECTDHPNNDLWTFEFEQDVNRCPHE